ncbi:MAG: hypothetical protein ACLFN5_01195 [bacterium]
MSNSLRRVVKLFIVIAGLSYLLVNCFLNLPLIRHGLHDLLVERLAQPVEIGYLYLNWKLNPTLSSLRFGGKNKENGSRARVNINYFQIKPAWRKLRRAFREGDYLEAINSVKIGRAEIDIFQRPKKPGLLQKLPDLETTIDSWRFRYIADREPLFSIGGQEMKFWSPDRKVEYELSDFMGEEIEGSGTIDLVPHFEFTCEFDRFSFPDRYWAGIDNIWQGKIGLKSTEEERLFTADFSGAPAVFGDFVFPDVDLGAEISISDKQVGIDTLELSSDYLYSSWEGWFNDGQDRVDIRGETELDLARVINQYARFYPELELSAVGPSPLKSEIECKGELEQPQLAGAVFLEQAKIDLAHLPGDSSLHFENWAGQVDASGVNWRQGQIAFDGYSFLLGDGFSEKEAGGMLNSVTGVLQATDFRPLFFSDRQTELLGRGLEIDIPLNISFLFTPEGIQAALAAREGSLALENFSLSDIWIMASYSSREKGGGWFGGNFRDGDGNEWEISGGSERPLNLKADLSKIDSFLALSGQEYLKDLTASMDDVELLLQFEEPLEDWGDYYGYLNFNDANISLPEHDFIAEGINGEMRIVPEKLLFSSIYTQSKAGQIQIDGHLDHSGFFENGTWDLNLRGKGLESAKYFSVSPEIGFGGLDFEVDIKGELNNPDLDLRLATEQVEAYDIDLENVVIRGTRRDGGLNFRLEEMWLGGGRVLASVQTEDDGRLSVGFKAEEIHLNRVLDDFDFVRKNIRGPVSLDGNIKGNYGELESWAGGLTVFHSGIELKKFPDLAGIHRVANLQEIGEDIHIDPATYNLDIEQGRIKLDGIRMTAAEKNLRLFVSGYLALNGEIDSTYELELRGDALASYLQDLVGEVYRRLRLSGERRLTIRFFVRETIIDPQISLDTDKIKSDFRSDFIENLLSETVGRPITRILDALFD